MLLQKMLKEKMKQEELSLRGAAKLIGVSHTTINRVLKGDRHDLDLDTLLKFSRFLGVPLSKLLGENEGTIYARIAQVVALEPALQSVFTKAYELLVTGELDLDDLREIASFAEYKLRGNHERERILTIEGDRRNPE